MALKTPAVVLVASGVACGVAWGQLDEPFPSIFELGDLCPLMGGDGSLGFVMEGGLPFGEIDTPSIAVLGDVNGDGIDDLGVGLNRSVDASPRVGSSYVIFGRGPDDPVPFSGVFGLFQVNGVNGFRLDGESSNDWASEIAGGGDINGDGINDMVINASRAEPLGRQNAGAIYVVYGRDDSIEPYPVTSSLTEYIGNGGFRINGQIADRLSGGRFIGDINGDGVDDIGIGKPREAVGRYAYAGVVHVIFGRSSSSGEPFPANLELDDIGPDQGFKLLGYDERDNAGTMLAPAGDINGDGISDMLVGAPGVDRSLAYSESDQGAVYVIFGRDGSAGQRFPESIELETLAPTDGFEIIGEGSRTGLGRSGAAAGDINNDGIDDIVIGARSDGIQGLSQEPGLAYVIYGRDASAGAFPERLDLLDLTSSIGFRMIGVDDDDEAGSSVNGGSDVNGDGINDIIVCAPNAEPDGASNVGESYVVYGRDTTAGACFPLTLPLSELDGRIGFTFRGVAQSDQAGSPAFFGADVNADGAPDIFLGSNVLSSSGPTPADQTYLVFGRQAPATCRPDLDGDGALTLFDFLAFQSAFSLGESAADLDCDGSLTLFDFLAFQSLFEIGCGE